MAQISRSTKISGGTTLAANTLARATDVETDMLTLFNAHNNHDSGTSKWVVVSAEGATSVPLVVNNSTGTQDIVQFKDNGTSVLHVTDGGIITAKAVATSGITLTVGAASGAGTGVALVADNDASTGDIFRATDGGTTVFKVADGGTSTFAPGGTTKVVANSSGLTLSNSATIAMGSAKITGLAAASANGDAVRYEQLPSVAGTITNWAALASVTVTGFGTISNSTFKYRQVGDSIQVRGNFTAGTTTAVDAKINLPTITVDTGKMASNINSPVGVWYNLTDSLQTLYSTAGAGVLFFDQSDNTAIYCSSQTSGNGFVKSDGSAICTASTNFAFFFEVPITGYTI